MKPAKAAPILETLDPQTVLEIVSRMKDRQAAKVLSSMNAGLASEISRRMSLKGESL
jgi:flagellar motility protein MotE (MotC chaperone)